MKQIGETTYYSKEDVAKIIGCTIASVNARVSAAGIDGYYMGRAKYYTIEQVKQIAEYRKSNPNSK